MMQVDRSHENSVRLLSFSLWHFQEEGNVPYVVDNGVGVFIPGPKETAKLVAEWFSTRAEELKKMSQNALQLAQPNAVFDIVKDIHELACHRGTLASIPC